MRMTFRESSRTQAVAITVGGKPDQVLVHIGTTAVYDPFVDYYNLTHRNPCTGSVSFWLYGDDAERLGLPRPCRKDRSVSFERWDAQDYRIVGDPAMRRYRSLQALADALSLMSVFDVVAWAQSLPVRAPIDPQVLVFQAACGGI